MRITNWARTNRKDGELHSYEYVVQAHRVDVTRSDGRKYTFCVGDYFVTYGGRKMNIESFDVTESAGVYGKGTGTDISLANQIDKMNDL